MTTNLGPIELADASKVYRRIVQQFRPACGVTDCKWVGEWRDEYFVALFDLSQHFAAERQRDPMGAHTGG